jgi:hypothetical protein
MEFNKLKDTLNNNKNLKDKIDFLQKNIRYFAAGALFLALVVVLASCVHSDGESDGIVPDTEISMEADTQFETEEGYQVDAVEAVNDLMKQYYQAYADGDMDTLVSLATPVSDNEKSYIAMMSQYVEAYENIKCYTRSGLEDGSYVVWVYMEVKFKDVETLAPGMELFYVSTNADGTLYIDNLYSNYNKSTKESGMDVTVQSLIDTYNGTDEIIALQQEVQTQYDAVVASDENLASMVDETIPQAVTEWMTAAMQQGTEVAENTEETEEIEETEETEEAEETETEENTDETDSESEEPQKETLYATARINVRASADVSSEKLGSVELGETVVRTGTDGEWSIIEYNGSTGYVKTEYLTTDSGSTSTDGDAGSITEGTVITLSATVNVRSSMSEDADKIGTAYAGEKVTVVMSYAEGWTKVTWNGTTGYIKTSLLK